MIDIISPLIKQFLPFAQKRMGFSEPPRLFLRGDDKNAQNPLGKTAYYDPNEKSITIYITGRHPKDVMRSISHELVHHAQNCRGEFQNMSEAGEGYAQEDPHLRDMEREAYEQGNLIIRDWEDSIKKKEPVMESDTKEIEKEIRDTKANRGDETSREVMGDINDTINARHTTVNDELMRRWGFAKKQEENTNDES